jgi:hypothetical protein
LATAENYRRKRRRCGHRDRDELISKALWLQTFEQEIAKEAENTENELSASSAFSCSILDVIVLFPVQNKRHLNRR